MKLSFPLSFEKMARAKAVSNHDGKQNMKMPYGCPGGSDSKGCARSATDLVSISWLGKPPGGGRGNPAQYSCLENPHGQRSLTGYSPWGRKESGTTERLSPQSVDLISCTPCFWHSAVLSPFISRAPCHPLRCISSWLCIQWCHTGSLKSRWEWRKYLHIRHW